MSCDPSTIPGASRSGSASEKLHCAREEATMRTQTVQVGQVMTRDVVSVTPETPLKDVATLLVERGISGLPVRGEDGTVLGVLSEADLLVKQGGPQRTSGGVFAWLVDTASAPDVAKL